MKIFDKMNRFYNDKLPFVVFKKPNNKVLSGFFMNNNQLHFTTTFKESGFVFAPFDGNKKSVLFPIESVETITEDIPIRKISFDDKEPQENTLSKEIYLKLINKTINNIENSTIEKIVISRKELLTISNFDLLTIYKKLIQKYKNAFVYCWFHPKVGLWLGATPETLLHIKDNVFKTMSLAGTQLNKNQQNVVWKSKELEEQQLVTDFIEDQLLDISTQLKIDKTETVKAGNLLHLRTKVEGKLSEKSNLKSLIRALHPTPAVCGLPRNLAKDFILENENYDRSFYTGFLGTININNQSSLYVNLRCMNIDKNVVSIYIGGGITKHSLAEKEWQETVFKSNTMKNVL